MARSLAHRPPLRRIVEWGVGGGANAVHFAPHCEEYFGVDIAPASVDECRRQMDAAGQRKLVPVVIDAATLEAACAVIPNDCDLFLCLYVSEIFPTPRYGLRVLKTAYELLRPGGLVFIQTRYITSSWQTKPRGWGYNKHCPSMTSYRIEEFWEASSLVQ